MKKTTMPPPGISQYFHSVPSLFGQAKQLNCMKCRYNDMSKSAQVKRIISVGHMTQKTDFSTILLHVETKPGCVHKENEVSTFANSVTQSTDQDFHHLQ